MVDTLEQLSRAVWELQKSEVPRVWLRARRTNFEVSLLECNAVRVGRVRVTMWSSEQLVLALLSEREKEYENAHHTGEAWNIDNTKAHSLARGLAKLWAAMNQEITS